MRKLRMQSKWRYPSLTLLESSLSQLLMAFRYKIVVYLMLLFCCIYQWGCVFVSVCLCVGLSLDTSTQCCSCRWTCIVQLPSQSSSQTFSELYMYSLTPSNMSFSHIASVIPSAVFVSSPYHLQILPIHSIFVYFSDNQTDWFQSR